MNRRHLDESFTDLDVLRRDDAMGWRVKGLPLLGRDDVCRALDPRAERERYSSMDGSQ